MHTCTCIIYYVYICSHRGSPPCTIMFSLAAVLENPASERVLYLGLETHIVLNKPKCKEQLTVTAVKYSGNFCAYWA